MISRLILTLIGATFLSNAAPVLTLVPSTNAIGEPGDLTGWGISVTPDPNYWVSFTGVILLNDSNPIGQFMGLLDLIGGPVNGALGPGATDWLAPFDPIQHTGFAEYLLDAGAAIGATTTLDVLVLYESFSDAPVNCSACYVDSGSIPLSFTAEIAAIPDSTVPEPASWAMAAIGLAACFSRAATKR